MIAFQSKVFRITGSNDRDIHKKVRKLFNQIEKHSKRKPYLRSPYFKKQKVFFDYFWMHLNQKGNTERIARLKYFECALDLIANSRNKPSSRINPNKKNEILYRFGGLSKEKELFFVQIKQDTKKKKLYFMSVFSTDN
jgi:hypothetical protein